MRAQEVQQRDEQLKQMQQWLDEARADWDKARQEVASRQDEIEMLWSRLMELEQERAATSALLSLGRSIGMAHRPVAQSMMM